MAILHFWEHHRDALAPRIKEFTERLGSKGGILEFLRTFPDLAPYIHDWYYISSEQLQRDTLPDLPNWWTDMPLLYRSSHPDDHRGYIGILPTLDSTDKIPDKNYYDLDWREQELHQIYRALAYFQKNNEEPKWVWGSNKPRNEWEYYYPSSHPRMKMGADNEIEYTDEPTADDIYREILGKLKSWDRSVDYENEILKMLGNWQPQHVRIVSSMRQKILNSAGHKEHRNIRPPKETGVYIQPKDLPSWLPTGWVFESPHKPWVFIISYSIPSDESEKLRKQWYDLPLGNYAETIVIDTNTWEVSSISKNGAFSEWYKARWLDQIIQLYKKVREKNIFWKDYSFHMEFGFDKQRNPRIYQVRQYSPFFQANFSLAQNERAKRMLIRGITDSSGERVRVIVDWDYIEWKHDGEIMKIIHQSNMTYPNPRVPLDQMKFTWTTWDSGIDEDHLITSLLYETGWVATAGVPKWLTRDYWEYTMTIISDGNALLVENIEQVN